MTALTCSSCMKTPLVRLAKELILSERRAGWLCAPAHSRVPSPRKRRLRSGLGQELVERPGGRQLRERHDRRGRVGGFGDEQAPHAHVPPAAELVAGLGPDPGG